MRKESLYSVLGATGAALTDQALLTAYMHFYDPKIVSRLGDRFIPLGGAYPWIAAVGIWVALVVYCGGKKTILPLVLMGGGVLSNVIAFVRFGVVVDYMPGFAGLRTNLADVMILAGIIFLLPSLRALRRWERP